MTRRKIKGNVFFVPKQEENAVLLPLPFMFCIFSCLSRCLHHECAVRPVDFPLCFHLTSDPLFPVISFVGYFPSAHL